MDSRKIIYIIAGWLSVGIAFGWGLINLLNPMAGMGFLIIIVSCIFIFVAPIIHILIERKSNKKSEYKPLNTVVFILTLILITTVILGFTGMFNFT